MTNASDRVHGLSRPHRSLLKYYVLKSLVFGPVFPFALAFLYFRFRTLDYRFDDQGVTVRWGVLFRREVSLTYSRLQDIHLVSNAVERQLGLARVLLQTAAGSAKAEVTVEGFQEFELVRDFLYERMRGARRPSGTAEVVAGSGNVTKDAVTALEEAAAELRALREELADRVAGAAP